MLDIEAEASPAATKMIVSFRALNTVSCCMMLVLQVDIFFLTISFMEVSYFLGCWIFYIVESAFNCGGSEYQCYCYMHRCRQIPHTENLSIGIRILDHSTDLTHFKKVILSTRI